MVFVHIFIEKKSSYCIWIFADINVRVYCTCS